jgi:hypothetical protein
MAFFPLGIELCRNPFVFENTKMRVPLLESPESFLHEEIKIQLNKLKKIICFFIFTVIKIERGIKYKCKKRNGVKELI